MTEYTYPQLVERMRKASRAIYIAVDETVADDISDMLTQAANALENLDAPEK